MVSTRKEPHSPVDDVREGAPAKEGVGSLEAFQVSREEECTGELIDVSPAVLNAEKERDSTLRIQKPQGLKEDLSGEVNAVTNSSLVCELPCIGVSSGIVLESVELSASLATEIEDELQGSHQHCARETGEACDDVDVCQRRTKGSQVGTKKRAKGRKRPKDKVAKVATRLRKGFKRRSEIARKVPLSSLTGIYRMRPSSRKDKSAAHSTRKRPNVELIGNHRDSTHVTADEHGDADEHRRWTEGSKFCSKKRAKRRKRPKNRNAAKTATRLKSGFRRRREIARRVRFSSLTGVYRMRPSRRKKKKRAAYCARKGSEGKTPPRCLFRGALAQVRVRKVGDLREEGGGDKGGVNGVRVTVVPHVSSQ
ncbi:hypothetical protein HPB52_014008 [Rhipicephalus sanguineus]|uniref:Uncharacterized protein n=1 Tax=Rhipicephalus sanguineus TaxID=34632 RepID=A0A9D4Q141_RHISA|nr:hypothetical protein HPB52_014008 [Rhipicephalus sanguineus]